jgi:TPR repeat protein
VQSERNVRTFFCFAVLLGCIVAAFADGPPADTKLLSADRTAQQNERTRAELDAARQAVAQQDWPRALSTWHDLYIHGNSEAPAQLCRMYFEGRQGRFDIGQAIRWCRLASADNPGGLYRMGLLYLVGLGVGRDIDRAGVMCAAARSGENDPEIAPGFCLAVVAQEKNRASSGALREAQVPQRGKADAAAQAHAPAHQCYLSFADDTAAFDPAVALSWCGQAAAAGDAGALYRLGLMSLMGVGETRNLALAELDCKNAEARSGGDISAAFCVAAARQLRLSTESLSLGRELSNIDIDPLTNQPLPKTVVDPYLVDRLLDAPHKTTTGLEYTCRGMQQWALFDAPGLVILNPRDKLFGRNIVAYRPDDFAALDQGAEQCIKAIAPADPRGTLHHNLTVFRRSLASLAARRDALLDEQLLTRAEASQIELENVIDKASVVILPSLFLTPHEGACMAEIRRLWAARAAAAKKHNTLEILASARIVKDGNYVVRGHAREVEINNGHRNLKGSDTFTCTFVPGWDEAIASATLQPNPEPRPQAVDIVR